MAGKITDASALIGANVATGDQLELVDVSDTSLAASGTNKKITADELAIALGTTLGLVGRDKIWDTKGDLAVATGADAASKLAIGADDLILTADSSQSTGVKWKPHAAASATHLPTGALAATFDRMLAGTNASVLTSGTLHLVQIRLVAGQVVTSISFKSGTTGVGTPTHQWFGLLDINRVALKFTGDDTNTAWAANTVKTLNLSSTYTVLTTADFYFCIMVAATTVGTMIVSTGPGTQVANIPPVLAGDTSDTGLTTVPTIPFTAGATTTQAGFPYAWAA